MDRSLKNMYFAFVFFFGFAAIRSVNADKILMSAMLGEGSHFLCSASVGEQLVKRGHNVTFLVSNAFAHRATDPKFTNHFDFEIFRHPIPVEEIHAQFEAFNTRAFLPASSQMWTLVEVIRDGRAADCEALLGDIDLMDRLAKANFSLITYDISWTCPILLASRLGIPYIAISAVTSPCTVTGPTGSVNTPSFVPEIMTGYSDKMNFRERVLNTLASFGIQAMGVYFYQPYNRIKEKYNIVPDILFSQMVAESELFLVNSDFSVEFPCALAPSVIPVGGLTTRPSDPLPDDLERFMQSSGEHGVVICSMGTYFTLVPFQVVKDFMNAFSRLPQKVVFQLRSVPEGITVPSNVLTLPWLPQNDLLGHAKTRAFMYQGGNNGFYEALYHAVPIVVMPIHGDQYDTGAKVVSRGLGLAIDKLLLSEDLIYDALHEVVNNVTFAQTSRRLSSMFRDRPQTPAEKAAFWVDHVMKHGGAQYKMSSVDLGVIERNLIDVTAFLLLCVILTITVLVLICRCFINAIKYVFRTRTSKVKIQ